MKINASILLGEKFKFLEKGHIVIQKDKIKKVGRGFIKDAINFKDYLIMPSLINSHTHIGDSFAKEAVLGLNVEEAVGKKGKKWQLYKKASKREILEEMKNSAEFMLSVGITHFADFREHENNGVILLKKALENLPIKAFIFGRGKNLNLSLCDGLGLNVYNISQIQKDIDGKLIAIHAGERDNEIERALACADVIIHFTKATKEQMKIAAEKKISIVICPRSNAALSVGIPPVREFLNFGLNVAIGTDNVMINSPNLWREMEFISKLSYLSKPLKPVEILSMVTINAAKIFGLNSGFIANKKTANLIFLDKNSKNLHRCKDILAGIIHRCEPENVRKVMINGKFVLDKDNNIVNSKNEKAY